MVTAAGAGDRGGHVPPRTPAPWWLWDTGLLLMLLVESFLPLRLFHLRQNAGDTALSAISVIGGYAVARAAHALFGRWLARRWGARTAAVPGVIAVGAVAAGGIWHGPPHYALVATIVVALLLVVAVGMGQRRGAPGSRRPMSLALCAILYLALLLVVDLNLLSLFPRHVSVFNALIAVAWLSATLSLLPPLPPAIASRAMTVGAIVTTACLVAAPVASARVAGYLRRQAEIGTLLAPANWARAVQPDPFLVWGTDSCSTPVEKPVVVSGTPLPRNVLFITVDTLRADLYLGPGETVEHAYPNIASLLHNGCRYDRMHSIGASTHVAMPALYNGQLAWAGLNRPILAATAQHAGLFARVYGGLSQISVYTGIAGGSGAATTSNTARMLADMENASKAGQHWMMVAHYLDLHLPRKAELLAEFSGNLRPVYARKLAALDKELGLLFGTIRQRGQWDDTIVVLTADHGEELNERGYSEHAFHLYETVLRVPFIARIPGQACLDSQTPMSLLDVVPMLTNALGLQITSPRLAGQWPPAQNAPLYSYSTVGGPFLAVTQNNTKVIVDARYGDVEVYDLAADPGEKHDLGQGLTPAIVEQLTRMPLPWNPLMPLAQRYRRFGGDQNDACRPPPHSGPDSNTSFAAIP